MLACDFTECQFDESIDLPEILFAAVRAGQYQWKRNFLVSRIQQDAKQVKHFFGGADAPGEHDDGVTGAHKCFQTFLDVRQYDQLVDNRVRRFCSDNAGFG